MIFDTHAHYDDEAFAEDRSKLLLSMKENNVDKIVDVGADMASTKEAVELAYNYDFIYAAVGVHPSEVEEMSEHDIETLRKYIIDDSAREDKKIVAIGEIGLDYHWEEPSRTLQKEWFAKQLELAQELEMPIIIHSRDAAEDTYEILKVYAEHGLKGVMHCYSYSVEMAKKYVDMGLYIGIGGVLTFKNAKKLKEVAAEIPLEKIVLETDCPYMAPEPHRGKRNDSTYIKYVVKVLAEIKGISEEEVERVTFENACKLYGIK
ncbi:TatD family hydrolase [uncultured Eubacterium sp.]|uniref:TatD family hydrolase n=1 Tax=uncultured Eubacterium sp. TaxID=165185 RepID=UPI000EC0D8A6|nr:TatD family hydrolase [uncultured Eubacterium sp.]HAH18972.1 hydrolase TatD [Eubacterium sp.]